ncbi:uncharacterized protein [Miscanthus floridulus]|uniref:uncharacterized protein n=1 Tax=Miscanthus floridulus TaxID=154761 RepID=UPI003458ED82
MRYMVRLHFPSSNNVAKYEALVNVLRIAIKLGIRCLDIRGDSQLVVHHVMKESSCHDAKMAAYCQEVRWLEDNFDGLELNHVLRHLNEAADALAKAASGQEPVPMGIFASDQHKPSVHYEGSEWAEDGPSDPAPRANPPTASSVPKVMELKEDPAALPDPPDDWRTPYLDYLLHDTLPMDKTEAQRLARRAKSFVLAEGELYRWSHTGILHLCIPGEQGSLLLSDIHYGVCGHHAALRTLVGNAFR